MSSMRTTPPFQQQSEEEEVAGQDAAWAKHERESPKETASPSSHDQTHSDELQPIREKRTDIEWDNVGPAVMAVLWAAQRGFSSRDLYPLVLLHSLGPCDNESNKICSVYSYQTNSTSPHKPEEGSRDRGEPMIGLAFGTPERRKGSLADVVDTLKQKKLVELTKTEQDGRARAGLPITHIMASPAGRGGQSEAKLSANPCRSWTNLHDVVSYKAAVVVDVSAVTQTRPDLSGCTAEISSQAFLALNSHIE
ncbi:unnamed protein product [Pleuronectes platessa]|uniref:Uncharacterized protein n=1 Tax=Pleuronectes platessa TaxID=8262 RepID=A0A9N7Z1A7_PLEPL|nr:unnamed protein product [Pleuronectes platessa]